MMLKIDYRLGGIPHYYLTKGEDDSLMQIPDAIRKCVVFVCYESTAGIKLAGTAFLVSIPLEVPPGLQVVYLITAKHVIEWIRARSIDQKVYLRMNQKEKGAKLVATLIDSWVFHPKESNVDVAVLNWAPPSEVFDYLTIPLDMAATEEVIKREAIGVGDDVFLTGLFENHFGSQRNLPIIRVGNIASMPEERVHTEELGDIDAYLVEARSIGGLSGSPVFVYLGSMRTVGMSMQLGRAGPLFYWLGLMHGHFDLAKLEGDALVEDSLTNLKINIGIAIVIPVWKILEVLNQEGLMKVRKEAAEQAIKKRSPTADSITEDEFKETLKKVSRKFTEPEKEAS